MSGAGIREVNTGTSYEGTCSDRKPNWPITCTGGIINLNRNPVLEARLVQGTCNNRYTKLENKRFLSYLILSNNVHIIMEHLG